MNTAKERIDTTEEKKNISCLISFCLFNHYTNVAHGFSLLLLLLDKRIIILNLSLGQSAAFDFVDSPNGFLYYVFENSIFEFLPEWIKTKNCPENMARRGEACISAHQSWSHILIRRSRQIWTMLLITTNKNNTAEVIF